MIDFQGTVWYCSCGQTKPRFEKDQVQRVFGGGIKCVCGGQMVVRKGAWVSEQYRKEQDGHLSHSQ